MIPPRLKLLMAARDPGAAGHMSEIARVAIQRGDLDLHLVAQPPALDMLKSRGLPVKPFPSLTAEGPTDSRSGALIAAADAVLAAFRPDAVLVGLSGPEAGIDEALLLRARNVPTFAMQDYWGDVNLSLGRPAELYLVMDEQAAALSRSRFQVQTAVVGAPKYASYADLDSSWLRWQVRSKPESGKERYVTWFGQPLWQYSAYAGLLAEFGAAVSVALPGAVLHYRPHPKETAENLSRALELMAPGGVKPTAATGRDTETWLAASDVVVSAFSSCGLDNIYLNRVSPTPLGITLYALSSPGIFDAYHACTGLVEPPEVGQGLALAAYTGKELIANLKNAVHPDHCARVAARINEVLPLPENAASKVLEQIAATCLIRRQ